MPKYKKGQVWNKVNNKLMIKFKEETGKNAVHNNKITGQFEYWLWQQEKKSKSSKSKPKPKEERIKKDILEYKPREDLIYKYKSKSKPKAKLEIAGNYCYLEFHGITATGGESKKFYEIQQIKKIVYTRYGRIDYDGKSDKSLFKSVEEAEKQFNKILNSKLAKGYKKIKSSTKDYYEGTGYWKGARFEKKKLESPKKKVTTPKSKRIYPMLAGSGDHLLGNPDYILQQKYDGTRCVIIKRNNTIKMISRSWKSNYTSNYPEIVNDIKKIPLQSFILDGELTFFKGNKDIFLTALATDETKKGYIAKVMVFDILEYNNKDVRSLPFRDRDRLLHKIIPNNLKHLVVVKSYKTNHKKLFEDIVSDKNQGEGIILKKLDSIYDEGGRTRDWVKLKRWRSDEAIIVGVTYGTGARVSTFGSLILAQYHKNKLVNVGKSSGFKMSEQEQLIKMMKPLIIKNPPGIGIYDSKVKYWVKPKIVIEVKFQEKTKDGKFRFPSFMRFRYDKEPKECIKR